MFEDLSVERLNGGAPLATWDHMATGDSRLRHKEAEAAKGSLMRLPPAREILQQPRLRWLVGGAALIIAAFLAANVVALVQVRQNILSDVQTSLLRQSLSLSELVDRTFQGVDLLLGSVAEKIRREAAVQHDLRQFANRATNEFLKGKLLELPQILSLGILDANGNRVNFSRGWPNQDVDLSYREYFQELKNNPRTEIFIGKPVQGYTTGTWIIIIARPVLSETGDFLGVVYASIVLKYFEDIFRTTSLGEGYAASLVRNDGTLLARYPSAGTVGMVALGPTLTRLGELGSDVSRAMSPIDHQLRIVAVHRLGNFPLVVIATQTERAAFATWHSILASAILITLALISMILVAAYLIARSWKQQYQLNVAHGKIVKGRNQQALVEAEMNRQRDLAAQSALFNAAVENMPQGLGMFDASQRLIICNERYRELYGLTREQTKQGTTLQSTLEARAAAGNSPEDVDAYVKQRLQMVREGHPYYVEDKLRDGRIIAITHQLMPCGGWVAVHQNITERKQAEKHQELLVRELDHRVKNVLARVAVVAKYTRQGSGSIDAFVKALDSRIQSMSDAHTLLSQSRWQGVSLADLVRRQLAPYATKTNLVIGGPDIMLSASATQALAMVLQELVTNAVKYGSLSSPSGRVSVSWDRVVEQGLARAVIVWRETGGPATTEPSRSSYGTTLIHSLIPHELGGAVELVFAPEGVRCDIEIPIETQLAN